jgi:hypothetical protein
VCAAALANYAKQADDDALERLAQRVRARAIRRCGELLRQIEKKHGVNQNIRGGVPPIVTCTQAARDAGLSDDQRKTALRMASIPDEDFEEAIESEDLPTMTELAERGTVKKPRCPLSSQTSASTRPNPTASRRLRSCPDHTFQV